MLQKDSIIDFDKADKVLGIEVLFVKETNPNLLKELKVQNLMAD